MFGIPVTAQEKTFLRMVLRETDANARLEHFKTIYNTSKRNNTTLQNAHNIVENNKKYAEYLNKKAGWKGLYQINTEGELIRNCRDMNGNPCIEKCSDDYVRELTDGIVIRNKEPKNRLYNGTKSLIRYGWQKFKKLFL